MHLRLLFMAHFNGPLGIHYFICIWMAFLNLPLFRPRVSIQPASFYFSPAIQHLRWRSTLGTLSLNNWCTSHKARASRLCCHSPVWLLLPPRERSPSSSRSSSPPSTLLSTAASRLMFSMAVKMWPFSLLPRSRVASVRVPVGGVFGSAGVIGPWPRLSPGCENSCDVGVCLALQGRQQHTGVRLHVALMEKQTTVGGIFHFALWWGALINTLFKNSVRLPPNTEWLIQYTSLFSLSLSVHFPTFFVAFSVALKFWLLLKKTFFMEIFAFISVKITFL